LAIWSSEDLLILETFDLFVVIDDGEMIESGTHDELINVDGHYAEMIRRQTDAVTV
jgi:ABC-type multidrug transport system fused ATPase/permease subunit